MAMRKSRPEIGEEATEPLLITPSSGNVFLDIGFPPAEAERLLVHSNLWITIESIIRSRRLTRVKAAALFGVTQSRLKDLLSGEYDAFRIDDLVEMLGSAGYHVRVSLEEAPEGAPAEQPRARTRSPKARPAKARPAKTRPTRARPARTR
jgi:predicted XRE-type DNA-binding protein